MKLGDLFEESPLGPAQVRNESGGKVREAGVTLTELAAHKKLPEAFLKDLGWRDGRTRRGVPCVEIPYANRLRIRTSLHAKEGSAWGEGEGMTLYAPRPAKEFVILCEGETDTASLLCVDLPAYGLPGATTQKTLQREHFEGIERVYVVREPDSAGEQFPKLCKTRLQELGLSIPVFPLVMPGIAKDPSALYQRDPGAFRARMLQCLAEASEPPVPTLAQAIPLMLKRTNTRLLTGLQTLDEATRGGIPLGSYCVLTGAPGAAKTTLSVCLLDRFERQGASCLYLAADEAPRGIVSRLGQLEGFSRAALEDAGDSVRNGFVERALGRRIWIADPDRKGLALEDCAKFLMSQPEPRVLVVDSVQTVRCLAAQPKMNAIEKTDAVIAVAKAVARQGVLVVALSEMNKAAYRGGNDQMNDLASNKGSSSIEYGVDLMITLRADQDTQGLVDAKITKSRIGKNNVSIKLVLDLDRADVAEQGAARDVHMEAIRRVLETVAKMDCKSRNEVLRYTVVRRDHGLQALTALIHEGRLKLVDGFIREVLPAGSAVN
jgi:KaiC/GvpD/RAD55 family RecA-like ATPase